MTARKPALATAIAFLALFMLATGCTKSDGAPTLTRVEPDHARSGIAVAVTIRGHGFLPLVRADYDDDQRSSIDTTFAVRLGAHAIEPVTYVSTAALTATVPADLPDGRYDVAVTDPRGRTATLPGGFTVGDVEPSDGTPDSRPDGPPDSARDGPPDDASDARVDGIPGGVVESVAADPFGDGTAFAFVVEHGGMIYLGPSKDGTGAVRSQPDGSSPQSVLFSFAADVTGNRSRNAASPPYRSIGAAGCAADTLACGPDNENGRAIFASGTIGGQSWLVVGGGRTSGDLNYLYMTPDTGSTLAFRFIDLSAQLGPQTKGISSMHVVGNRVYLGLPDTGGKRPYLVVLKKLPSAPGLDAAASADAENLRADKMPGVGTSSPMTMVDAIATFTGRVYLANAGGWMRATAADPVSYDAVPSDWTPITPSAAPYAAKPSVTTTKVIDIEPADKAVPAFASFMGKLYAARNTSAGPQLWACTPAQSGDALQCDSADWALIAANGSGDGDLSQFDNPNNTAITLLVATGRALYVGFNNSVDGITLFRTTNPSPSARGHFEGRQGCSAAAHPASCQGLGANGLGVATNTRIFDGAALTFGGADYLYVVCGDGSGPVRVYRVRD